MNDRRSDIHNRNHGSALGYPGHSLQLGRNLGVGEGLGPISDTVSPQDTRTAVDSQGGNTALQSLESQIEERCAIRRCVVGNVDLFDLRCDTAKLLVGKSLETAGQVEEGPWMTGTGEVQSEFGHGCVATEEGMGDFRRYKFALQTWARSCGRWSKASSSSSAESRDAIAASGMVVCETWGYAWREVCEVK